MGRRFTTASSILKLRIRWIDLKAGSQFVRQDLAEVASLGAIPVTAPLLNEEGPELRHCPGKLGRRVLSITRAWVGSAASEGIVTSLKEPGICPIQAAA